MDTAVNRSAPSSNLTDAVTTLLLVFKNLYLVVNFISYLLLHEGLDGTAVGVKVFVCILCIFQGGERRITRPSPERCEP